MELIHDRFQRDAENRDSQLKIGWTEEKCIEMDKLAHEDHSHCPSSEELRELRKLVFSLNKSGRNAPMKLRSDFREAVKNMNRCLHRESGEKRPEQSHCSIQKGDIRLLLPVLMVAVE